MSKGAQIAVGAIAVVLLLGWYGFTNLGDQATFQYYQTLEEFHRAGFQAPPDRSLRVHGYVAEDSIERDVGARQVRFAVQNDPPHAGLQNAVEPLRVEYLSLETPDLFRDGAEVVVEGRIEERAGHRVFVATNVLAKCPSKFQAKAELEKPEEAEL